MSPPRLDDGPGTRIARLLKRFGISRVKGCACSDNVLFLNAKGHQWVRENADLATSILREEASRRGLPFIAPLVKRLVLHCATPRS